MLGWKYLLQKINLSSHIFTTFIVLLFSVILFTGCSSDSKKPATEIPTSDESSSEENDGDSCIF